MASSLDDDDPDWLESTRSKRPRRAPSSKINFGVKVNGRGVSDRVDVTGASTPQVRMLIARGTGTEDVQIGLLMEALDVVGIRDPRIDVARTLADSKRMLERAVYTQLLVIFPGDPSAMKSITRSVRMYNSGVQCPIFALRHPMRCQPNGDEDIEEVMRKVFDGIIPLPLTLPNCISFASKWVAAPTIPDRVRARKKSRDELMVPLNSSVESILKTPFALGDITPEIPKLTRVASSATLAFYDDGDDLLLTEELLQPTLPPLPSAPDLRRPPGSAEGPELQPGTYWDVTAKNGSQESPPLCPCCQGKLSQIMKVSDAAAQRLDEKELITITPPLTLKDPIFFQAVPLMKRRKLHCSSVLLDIAHGTDPALTIKHFDERFACELEYQGDQPRPKVFDDLFGKATKRDSISKFVTAVQSGTPFAGYMVLYNSNRRELTTYVKISHLSRRLGKESTANRYVIVRISLTSVRGWLHSLGMYKRRYNGNSAKQAEVEKVRSEEWDPVMQPVEMDEMLASENIKYLVDGFVGTHTSSRRDYHDKRASKEQGQVVEYDDMLLDYFGTILSEEDAPFGRGGAARFPSKMPRSGLNVDEQQLSARFPSKVPRSGLNVDEQRQTGGDGVTALAKV